MYPSCTHSKSEDLYIALLSYLVLKEEARGLDTWTELALEPDPVPLAVCNVFRVSWVSDWTVPRVG